MARYLRDRIAIEPNVEVMLGCEVREVHGPNHLEHVTVEEAATGVVRTLDATAMVVLIGAQPPTEWLAAGLDLDNDGYIHTGPALGPERIQHEPWKTLGREPFPLETSRPGVFAIGDVRSGSTKMVAPAAGEGGMAVRLLTEHLAHPPTPGPSIAQDDQARHDPHVHHHQKRHHPEAPRARAYERRPSDGSTRMRARRTPVGRKRAGATGGPSHANT
jgi:hypothetical protein